MRLLYQKIPALIRTVQIITIAWIVNVLLRGIIKICIPRSNRGLTIFKLLGSFIKYLVATIVDKAEENATVIAPGYTHLQRAQPISFGHHLIAYAMMLLRDIGRIEDGVFELR